MCARRCVNSKLSTHLACRQVCAHRITKDINGCSEFSRGKTKEIILGYSFIGRDPALPTSYFAIAFCHCTTPRIFHFSCHPPNACHQAKCHLFTGSANKKLLPVMYKSCDVPAGLKHIAGLYYTKDELKVSHYIQLNVTFNFT